jgi:hypothetical protein
MDFEVGWAAGAGLMGGAAMTAVLYMGIAMMPNQMRMNLLPMLGTMMLPMGPMAYVAGGMVHGVMSAVFGLVHAGVFAGLDIESATAAWGLLFGLVHWAAAGMALGMMPLMHRGIQKGEIEAPGYYALRLGPATAMGFLMLHLLFGLLVGVIYGAAVG